MAFSARSNATAATVEGRPRRRPRQTRPVVTEAASTPTARRASRCRMRSSMPETTSTSPVRQGSQTVVESPSSMPVSPQGVALLVQRRSDHDAFDLLDGHRVRRAVAEFRRLRRRVPPRFPGRAQVARSRRRERPRPIREPDSRGREDVGLDVAAGGGRAASGPPGGLRQRTCDELRRGGRRDVDDRGETEVFGVIDCWRTRRPPPPSPSSDSPARAPAARPCHGSRSDPGTAGGPRRVALAELRVNRYSRARS